MNDNFDKQYGIELESYLIFGIIKYKEEAEIKIKYEEYIGKNNFFNLIFFIIKDTADFLNHSFLENTQRKYVAKNNCEYLFLVSVNNKNVNRE